MDNDTKWYFYGYDRNDSRKMCLSEEFVKKPVILIGEEYSHNCGKIWTTDKDKAYFFKSKESAMEYFELNSVKYFFCFECPEIWISSDDTSEKVFTKEDTLFLLDICGTRTNPQFQIMDFKRVKDREIPEIKWNKVKDLEEKRNKMKVIRCEIKDNYLVEVEIINKDFKEVVERGADSIKLSISDGPQFVTNKLENGVCSFKRGNLGHIYIDVEKLQNTEEIGSFILNILMASIFTGMKGSKM